jgi:LysR family transcriptional regulator, transcription activator of glutamate synthase operon
VVNLADLEWFVALAENPHMTQVAERLHTTQPTLSRSIARLEQELGAPLFDRTNRRLRLNPSGEVLLRHARRGLLELRAAAEHIDSLRHPDRGTVRLGFLHSVSTWLAPELIRAFRAEAPDVQFVLTQAATYELADLVEDGAVDLAVTGPRPPSPQLAWHTVHREQLCLVVPHDHRLAACTGIDIAAAGDEPFIQLGRSFGLRHLTDALLDRAGAAPAIAFEATEIPTMESLAAAGLGVAVVPRPRPHRADPNAAYIPLRDAAAHRTLGIAWRADRPESPVVHRFRTFVTAHDWSAV